MPNPLENQATRTIEQLLAESGVRAPAKLETALEAYHACTLAEFTPTDVPAVCATIAPADVPGLLAQLTRERVFGPDAILKTESLAEVQSALDVRVRREFAPVVGAVTDGYKARFDETAGKLTDAIAQLPTTLKLEHVSRHGTEALAAWGRAQEATAELDNLAGRWEWLAGFVGRAAATPIERAGKFCAFDSRDRVNEILGAQQVPPFGQWASLANLEGVTLRWGTLEELGELTARFAEEDRAEAARTERQRQEFRRQHGDAWLGIVESREPSSTF